MDQITNKYYDLEEMKIFGAIIPPIFIFKNFSPQPTLL